MEIKARYIEAFKEELGTLKETSFEDIDINQIISKNIWRNTRETGGLRLTYFGKQVLSEHLQLKSYSFEMETGYSGDSVSENETFLLLEKHLNCPYYINERGSGSVTLYDSKLATAIALGGDIKKFLKIRKSRKKNS